MQIILRGRKVKTLVIAKSLAKTELDLYTPTGYVSLSTEFIKYSELYSLMLALLLFAVLW